MAELRFPVEIDDSQASKELNHLASTIQSIRQRLTAPTGKSSVTNQLKTAQEEAEEARASVERLRAALAESERKTSPEGVSDPGTFLRELEYQEQIRAELQKQEKALVGKEKAAAKEIAQLTKLADKEQQQTAREKTATAKSSLTEGLKSLFSKGAGAKENLTDTVKGLSNSFGMSLKRILAFGFGIRSLYALFRKLSGYIKESITAFAQYDRETQGTINNLKSALAGLQASWGAAFAPILNAVAPILQTLISWLNVAAQAIAQFMAVLTGKGSFKKAVTNTGDLASNLGGAADNAKEAKKQLMGIDDLTVFNDTDTSGGGGGSGADAATFEDVAVDAESLPAKIAAALKAGEWAEAATLLTGKLNDMIASVDWAGIGSKIGYYLNGALVFLATALITFDWAALAGNLTIMLNHIITSVDWANLGVLFTAKFRVLLLAIVGFLLNFDWGAFATGLSQFAIGFLNGIANALQQVDWSAVGMAIMTAFGDIIAGTDWSGVANSLINALGAALTAAAVLLGVFVGYIAEKIKSFFADFDDQTALDVVEGFLIGVISALANIGAWVKQNVVQPFVDGFKAAFGIHSPSTVMKELGGYVMDGLKLGITNKISAVVATFDNVKSQITNKLQALVSTAKSINWADIGVSIVNGIITGLNNGWQWLINAVTSICSGLLNTAKSILGIHSPSTVFRDEVGENVGAGIEEGLENSESGILTQIRGITSNMLTGFENVPNSIASQLADIGNIPMPAVAMGTVVPPNATGGGYAYSALESKIDALLDKLNNGGGGGKIEPSDIYLDKRKVGEVTYEYIQERERGRGK